jgi:uncharacterized protein
VNRTCFLALSLSSCVTRGAYSLEKQRIEDQPPLDAFSKALVSGAPSPELGPHAYDLAWLVGGWTATVRDYDDRGGVEESSGEWWFAWVLEGRALQDVWIVPARKDAPATRRERYGTTIRWFDKKSKLWRISWINPVTGVHNDLSGKRYGNRLVFEGITDGKPIRWSFNDITPSRFIWRGEDLSGDTPRLGSEFIVVR